MWKKALCLIFAFLLSINSFAAVVSDNDGSAFITKAEFDSLKNNFQSQLDQYNANIDNKIDNAIASYLAGISKEYKESKRLFFAGWGKVTMLNQALSNTWAPPNINLSLGWGNYNTTGWPTTYWACAAIQYTRGSTLKGKRLLVDAGTEGSPNDNAVWMGRSINLVDNIKLSRMVYSEGDLAHICWHGSYGTTATNKFSFTNITQIKEGYFSDLNGATTNLWVPRFYWDADLDNVKGVVSYVALISTANALNIELKEESNKTTDYDHILNWDNYTWPQVTDVDWTKSLRKMSGSTYTCKWILDNATKKGKWAAMTCSGRKENWRATATVDYGQMAYKDFTAYYSSDYGTNDTNPTVGVGLVNKTYDSWHLYQSDTVFDDKYEGKEYKSKKLALCEGLPLLACKKDDKVTIELEFNNGIRDGVAEPNMEVDVSLAMEPFGTLWYVSDDNKRVRCDGYPVDYDYYTTSNGKLKLKWQMKEDGIVYIKYKPNDTTGSWQVDLDLSKNPTYTIGKELQ